MTGDLIYLVSGILIGFIAFWIFYVLLTRQNKYAVAMIEQDNLRLRQENSLILRDNATMAEEILKLKQRVHELELKIDYLINEKR